MWLEHLAGDTGEVVKLPMFPDEKDVLRVDWSPLLLVLRDATLPVARRAAIFHNSMAETIVQQVLSLRNRYSFTSVGLTGGVFQNRRLTEQVLERLEEKGCAVYLPTQRPCNDGGLSYGQAVEAAAVLASDAVPSTPELS
jgi:hydrogenase maturation protein HypF